MHRRRYYCAMIRRASLVFVGSIEEYLGLFRCSLRMDGDDLMVAPSSFVKAEFAHFCAQRKVSPDIVVNDWSDLYPPYMQAIVHSNENDRMDRASLKGTFLADVEQTKGTSSCSGPLCPCLVRHGTIYSWKKGRHYVPEEHLLAQGIPAVPGLETEFRNPWVAAMDYLTAEKVKSLAGNAMNMKMVTTLTFYILSTVCKIRKTSPRALGPPGLEHDEPDDASPAASSSRLPKLEGE
jgi:hypothetical protein